MISSASSVSALSRIPIHRNRHRSAPGDPRGCGVPGGVILGARDWGYARSCKRTSENPPSTHSGELTLATKLLQHPTYRDHGPTEHGKDESALQVRLTDPESSLSSPHSMPSGPPEHHISLSPPPT